MLPTRRKKKTTAVESLTVPINEAEQGNGIKLPCAVVTELPAQLQISTVPLL